MNLPIDGFLNAPVTVQVIFLVALAAVGFGLMRPRPLMDSAFVGMIVVLGYFFLALGCLCYIAAGGAL